MDVGDQMHVSGQVVANFAWQHMRASATFRDRVVEIESENANAQFGAFFEDIRSYGSGCIMSAVASIEALINELFIDPRLPLRQQLTDFERSFWARGGIEWKPPLEKYQIALDMLGRPRLAERTGPFQEAWGLVELRNALVHYKPAWDA